MRVRQASISKITATSVSIPARPISSRTHLPSSNLIVCHNRSYSSSPSKYNDQFRRSDFGNQPFTSIYDPSEPTAGPLGGTSNVGAPKITPRILKQRLDEYVIGQDRAKRVLSTAVFNHYQRMQELQRQEYDYQEQLRQKARSELANRHPVEGTSSPLINKNILIANQDDSDEFPGQYYTPPPPPKRSPKTNSSSSSSPLRAPPDTVNLEKSNVLLLGPSGVGKTLMVKTLASIMDVPFTISDCTPLTSAGYIGEDAEVVVQRLLAAANYDVSKAETGIICLDEFDKIASVKVSHGKDVGGEGVQQALLKIIEGTSVTVQAKNEKVSNSERDRNHGSAHAVPPSPSGKNDVYTVKTDNILFICAGAFNGLHKNVLDRIAKGSIGFNAPVRASNPDSSPNNHDTTIEITSANAELYKEHLPYWSLSPSSGSPYTHSSDPFSHTHSTSIDDSSSTTLNLLDLVTPADLQKFGLIPELIGRVPVHTAVANLSIDALVRVLTEPRNALLKQYKTLFLLSNIELHFSQSALRKVAEKAVGMGTGARGLRNVLEGVLSESMFEAPGSSTKYILVTEEVIMRKLPPIHLARGQGQLYQSLVAEEERREADKAAGIDVTESRSSNFQEYRQKVSAAGV